MAMQEANWITCPGITNDGLRAHSMRDNCGTCAPFWEKIPMCPHCGGKLMKRGKTKCKKCAKFVNVGSKPCLTSEERDQYTDLTRYPVYRPKGG